MSFNTIKADLNSEEANRKVIENALISLLEQKKKLVEKVRLDIASGLNEDPNDTTSIGNLTTQITSKKNDLAISLTNIETYLSNYESLDPWHPSVIGSFDDNTPILLFPVRTETRFETFDDNGIQKYELWVRIFPDDLEINTHEEALSPVELEDGQNFNTIYTDSGKSRNEKLNAWNTLCVSYGQERAAWIAKYFKENLTTEKYDSWTEQPQTQVMPDKFVVYLYSSYNSSSTSNTPDIVSKGKPIPPTLKVGINPNDEDSLGKDVNGNIETISNEIEWMFDFQKAIDKGMGLKIPLTLTQYNNGFERLTVLGIKNVIDQNAGKSILEDLLESQHMTNGFSILKQGSNTNNTELKKSSYSSLKFGNEETYITEIEGVAGGGLLYNPTTNVVQKTDGQRLAEALGIDYKYTQNIHGANGYDIRNAMIMGDNLYSATVGYFLLEMMHPLFSPANLITAYDPQFETRKFFKDFVSSRGALPTIRIGTQPYGILPVSTNNISEGTFPPNVVDQYYNDLYDLIEKIDVDRRNSLANITFAGGANDPQHTMADILGKHAVSTHYAERLGVGPDYIWNQLSFTNQVGDAMGWKANQDNFKLQFQNSTGLNFPVTPKNLQFNLREELNPVTKPIVSNKRNSDTKLLENITGGTSNYIFWMSISSINDLKEENFTNIGAAPNTPAPNALLYDYLRQSLLLEYYEFACILGGVPYVNRREKNS